MIKNIFARIWALWALITFVITFLLIFLPSMISYIIKDKRKAQVYFIAISKLWMNIWLPLAGCPVKVKGKSNFEKGKTYIVVFNHNALLDVPLSAPYVPGPSKTIAKASFAKVPLFGWFYSKGSILVDRNSEKSRIKSYEEMKRTLALGIHMSIYPEGTRNRTAQPLKSFYDGAFKLAADTGTAVVPCVITGTKKAMPVHKVFYLLPVRLTMIFLPPVPANGIPVKELKEKVFNLMQDYYIANN